MIGTTLTIDWLLEQRIVEYVRVVEVVQQHLSQRAGPELVEQDLTAMGVAGQKVAHLVVCQLLEQVGPEAPIRCRCGACQAIAPLNSEWCERCQRAGCDHVAQTKRQLIDWLGRPEGWTIGDVGLLSPPPCTMGRALR